MLFYPERGWKRNITLAEFIEQVVEMLFYPERGWKLPEPSDAINNYAVVEMLFYPERGWKPCFVSAQSAIAKL